MPVGEQCIPFMFEKIQEINDKVILLREELIQVKADRDRLLDRTDRIFVAADDIIKQLANVTGKVDVIQSNNNTEKVVVNTGDDNSSKQETSISAGGNVQGANVQSGTGSAVKHQNRMLIVVAFIGIFILAIALKDEIKEVILSLSN
jgi:hypothetical protein